MLLEPCVLHVGAVETGVGIRTMRIGRRGQMLSGYGDLVAECHADPCFRFPSTWTGKDWKNRRPADPAIRVNTLHSVVSGQ